MTARRKKIKGSDVFLQKKLDYVMKLNAQQGQRIRDFKELGRITKSIHFETADMQKRGPMNLVSAHDIFFRLIALSEQPL